MDILWSVIFIGFFFIVIYFAWIVDNILHKINEERIRIAEQRNAVMPTPNALDSNLVSSSFICYSVVSSVSSHSNGYYGMVLRYIIFPNTPHTLADRQNTVELGRQHSRYGDIFYIEPNSQEAARIREQLEKDEKDLPSYEEVMRMCNLTTPTAAVAPPPTQPPMMESNAIGIAALPAPPYSEIDPHRSVTTPPPPIATGTTVNTSEPSPSTSRAAQITT
ncbi:uncharacterized protein LOC108653931 isoform X2 [Drosophila navojoa]|uniref:uncharacterized protein LOC108653931 isoform X2 n=1 Tax=Drosophila navojoa TaxID=7232 RepID=UPI0011BFDC8F|nr:uncharacterized protein LOC108653931 isoform X2 [Drosophila navojoa]